MHIQWVELREFRNYRSLSYTPAETVNVLAGPNAQGKTNLLEGLSILLSGRSFRTLRAGEIPRWGALSATVSGGLQKGEIERTVRRVVHREAPGGSRVTGEGCPWARAVTFGWQDLPVVGGPPQARRGFLDAFAGKLYAAHPPAVLRYRQIVDRRNRLLQSGRGDPEVARSLAPWDEQLSFVGAEIMAGRRRAVELLQTEASRLYPEMAGEGKVSLIYETEIPGDGSPREILDAVQRRRGEELARGRSLVGPHRDDLRIDLDGADMRVYGSRGRQRLLALILRLAEVGPICAALGSPPILLLDDALSELDPAVQAAVVKWIGGVGQVFLTTADPALLPPGAARWEVAGGAVEGPFVLCAGGAA